jgi:uncharacterized protein with PIN domain
LKFVVDAMLGKLALWLRLTGHDAVYSATLDDGVALELAERENRILLTSDEALSSRAVERGLETMLVRGSVDEEVAAVFVKYHILAEIDPSTARCSKCNGELEEIQGDEKARIRPLVHDKTYSYYDTFWLCNNCNSVFFQGSYWKNIQKYMARIRDLINNHTE